MILKMHIGLTSSAKWDHLGATGRQNKFTAFKEGTYHCSAESTPALQVPSLYLKNSGLHKNKPQ